MTDSIIQVGDCVKLLSLPDWLIHDLPKDEQKAMLSFVGKNAIVDEIDSCGYYWLGFGSTIETNDAAYYTGHSFCVSREFIELESF